MSNTTAPSPRRWLVPVALVVAVGVAGWYIGTPLRDQPDETQTNAEDPTIGSIHRDIRGQVVRLAPEDASFTVDHEEIPGFMRAMVMDLQVLEPRELRGLAPGDEILFDLAEIEGTFKAVRIRLADPDDTPASAAPDDVEPLRPGDHVPDLALVDARGERFRLHEFPPRHKVITFFYARCPLEHFCPDQSRRLAELQGYLEEAGRDVHLLSLTLDAEHDGADVLAGYADRFNADPARWTLAGGDDPEAIRRFARQVGARVRTHEVTYEIDHALVAVRVDGTRIVDSVYGLEAIEAMVRGM